MTQIKCEHWQSDSGTSVLSQDSLDTDSYLSEDESSVISSLKGTPAKAESVDSNDTFRNNQ